MLVIVLTMTLLYIIWENKSYRRINAASEKYELRLDTLFYSYIINKVPYFKTVLLQLKRLVDKISLISFSAFSVKRISKENSKGPHT